MLLAAPLSIAIGLFLSELAPPSIRGPIGTLVEMLAAVPSVVVGLWGIYVLAPFDAQHVQPFLGSAARLDPDLRARPATRSSRRSSRRSSC